MVLPHSRQSTKVAKPQSGRLDLIRIVVAQASGWLDTYREFWEKSYLNLDALLQEMKVDKKKRGGKSR